MSKRRFPGRIDEVAFADVAMAVLGPILLLMLLFMGIAAKSRAAPSCDVPDERRAAELSAGLKQWVQELRADVQSRRDVVGKHCASAASASPPAIRLSSVPEPLAGICAPAHQQVFDKAGIDRSMVDRLLAERDDLSIRIGQCLGVGPDALCRRPSPAEAAFLGEQIKGFARSVTEENGRLREMARQRCGKDGPVGEPGKASILPAALLDVCTPDREAILKTAGLSQQELAQRIAARDAAVKTLEQCTGLLSAGACRPLQPPEVAVKALEVKRWLEEIQTLNREDEDRIGRQCPTTLPNRVAAPTFLPDTLIGVCQPDVDGVLKAAGVAQRTMREAQGARQVRLEVLRTCTPQDSSSRRKEHLEFKECLAEPALSGSGLIAYFDRLADRVVDEVARGRYNRVDVFGHTDNRELRDRCRDLIERQYGVSDANNPVLASLRAHRVRTELVKALERNQASADHRRFLDRLDRRELRIYAIGVGGVEPDESSPQSLNEEDRLARNRRMELRYVWDPVGSAAP